MGGAERPEGFSAVPKEDPEALVLRGPPRPVIRFRRGFIIAVTASAGSALIALAWAALEPVSFITTADRKVQPAARPSPEGIAGAPASYADVPQLGPPLPGDLGRAVVDGKRGRGGTGDRQPPDAGSESAAQQAIAAARQAARESPVLAHLSRPAVPAGPDREAPTASSEAGSVPGIASLSPPQRRAQDNGSDNDRATRGVFDVPRSPWTLVAGTVIPASLLTGLNSELPGTVVAQVTQDVRDSVTGGTILIPRGARLIGDYDSRVAFGQMRMFLVWTRLIFPGGSSVDLGAMPATDAAGNSGIEDQVDFHEWRLFKGIVLSSILGVGSELAYAGGDRGLIQALRESAQSNGARAGDAIVSRNLDVRPTVTVRPGWPIRALLRKDLVLKPWRGR